MKKKLHIKELVKLLLPPIFVGLAKYVYNKFFLKARPEWEYVPSGWKAQERDPNIKGWNVQSILDTYIAKWPDFVASIQGTDPLGLSSEQDGVQRTDLAFHNIIMTYAYALSLAARQRNQISLLDWGGGIGHYYLIGQTLLPELRIDYHCKDLPIFVEHGQKLFPEAHFYASTDCLNRQYDFVMSSSSLQYSPNWQEVLEQLARATSGYLYLTRLPVVHHVPSYVMIQRPYRYGYNSEYLGWCLNRTEILSQAQHSGLELVREFMIENPPFIEGAPEQCNYWGFLFKPYHK